jgi:hypothetical protein
LLATCRWRIFTAIGTPRVRCSPRYTSPIPPEPRRRVRLYFPARTVPGVTPPLLLGDAAPSEGRVSLNTPGTSFSG